MAGGRTWQLFTANGTAGCLKAEDKRKKVCRRYLLCSPPIDGHVVPLRGRKFSFSAPLPRLSGKLMIQTDTEIQFDLIPKFRVKVNSKMQVHRSSPQTSDRFKVVPVRICRNKSALSQTFMLLWSFDVWLAQQGEKFKDATDSVNVWSCLFVKKTSQRRTGRKKAVKFGEKSGKFAESFNFWNEGRRWRMLWFFQIRTDSAKWFNYCWNDKFTECGQQAGGSNKKPSSSNFIHSRWFKCNIFLFTILSGL